MKRHRRSMTVISEINLTNLVDTSFVLLIGFMLMAPTIKHGVDISVPKVGNAGTLATDTKTVTIAIKRPDHPGDDEHVYIDDQRVSVEKSDSGPDIESVIHQRQQNYPKLDVIIEGDTNSTLGMFTRVTTTLRNMGIDNVGIMTQPPEDKTEAPKAKKPGAN